MTIYSFAFKDGGRSPARSVVLDCRQLPNPHRWFVDRDGRDHELRAWVHDMDTGGTFRRLLAAGEAAVRAARDVAYGCHGGRHRSVMMAEALAAAVRATGAEVTVRHLALEGVSCERW